MFCQILVSTKPNFSVVAFVQIPRMFGLLMPREIRRVKLELYNATVSLVKVMMILLTREVSYSAMCGKLSH